MNQKLPLSLFIIAKNEEDRISKAIVSAKDIADEIIVVLDSKEDKTFEVAKNLGAKILINPWQGYGKQKAFGENACKNEIILNLDADEQLSDEIKQEIINLFQSGGINAYYGFVVKVKISMNGQKPKKLADSIKTIRLYNKTKASFCLSTVHDSVIIEDKKNIGKLKGIIYHHCFRNLHHWSEKLNNYSSMQAKDYVARNRKIPTIRVLVEAPIAFFKAYILRRYFIYGFDGIIYSFMYVFGRMLRLGKIREEYQKNAKHHK